MDWKEAFDAHHEPTLEEIRTVLGEAVLYWDALTGTLEEIYKVKPKRAYSQCAAQPGWNVKYQKSSKALCTLYPMKDTFIALVVVGPKEEDKVREGMEAGVFTPALQGLYATSIPYPMGRWLMIEVKNDAVLSDILKLIELRVIKKSG